MTAVPPPEHPGGETPSRMRGVVARVAARLTPVAAAWQFLTVAPPLVHRPFTEVELGRSVGYFPAVGLLIGAALAGADLASRGWFAPGVGASVLVAAWVGLTGALHLDGLLDSCDGLFGGRTPEDRLRILRDERVGAFAVVGAVLVMLIKYAALANIHARGGALVLAPTLGRWAVTIAVTAYPYRREDGLGRAVKVHAGWRESGIATVTAVAATAAFGVPGAACLGAAFVSAWWVARCAMNRIGGLTGDVYGAVCEVAEAAVLLAWSAWETGLT